MIVYEILTLLAGVTVLVGVFKLGEIGFRKLEHNQNMRELEAEKLKWSGNLPTTVVGDSSKMFFNLDSK